MCEKGKTRARNQKKKKLELRITGEKVELT